jgi:hypothetical protein
MAGAHQPRLAHQARDPFAAVPFTAPTQIGMNARRPVGLPRTGMHGLDALQQRHIGGGVRGRRALQPGVVTRLGHAEHTCHRDDRERGLVRAHEPEELDGSTGKEVIIRREEVRYPLTGFSRRKSARPVSGMPPKR